MIYVDTMKTKIIQLKNIVITVWNEIKQYNLEWGMKWDDYD